MQDFIALLGIIGTIAIGAISPGPSFILVARIAVVTSRVNGLAASLGMGVGGLIFATAALCGLQAVLLAVPDVYAGLKILGGLYLCYLAYRIFSGAKQKFDDDVAASTDSPAPISSFWLALSTQLSNPKAAVIYTSVFAAFLPASPTLTFSTILLLAVLTIETGWYAIVTCVLSSTRSRRFYLGYKTFIDRMAGALMFALGIKLIVSAIKD